MKIQGHALPVSRMRRICIEKKGTIKATPNTQAREPLIRLSSEADHKIQQHDRPVVDASNQTLKVEGITPELGVSIQHAVVASL